MDIRGCKMEVKVNALPKNDKELHELNRFILEQYPNENVNLNRLALQLHVLGLTDKWNKAIESMTVPGSPFLKLSERR